MKTYKISSSQTRALINEVNNKITFSAIPKTIKKIQEEFIKSIPTNDYFTSQEKYALTLYFESYSNFYNKNIILFESQVSEDIADWFKSGWQKIKSTFGGIKNYVVEIWAKIKKFFIDLILKGKDVVKGLVEKAKDKIKVGFEKVLNGPNKDDLLKELKNIVDIANWIKTKVSDPNKILSPIANKIIDPTISKAEDTIEKIQESIFSKQLTAHLANPNLLLESEDENKWKKWLMNTVKIILNPVMGGFGVLGSWAGSYILTKAAKFIERLGGPKAIEYEITPEIIFAALETTGAYEGAWNWVEDLVKEYAKYIPYAGELIELWHFGHKILFGYALYEIIKEITEALGSGVKNLTTENLETLRMQKLAGIV